MKECPECKRTYPDDTLAFCLADGSLLSAPFDPHATLVIPETRQTEPPPTEVLRPEIPPTVASPKVEQKPRDLVSTIAAPAPIFESPQSKVSPVQPMPKSHRRVWVICGILVLVIGVGIALLKWSAASKRAVADAAAAEQHAQVGYKFNLDGKYAEAEAEYREASKLEPNKDLWHFQLAGTLQRQKKYTEAEAEYRKAIRLKPDETMYQDYLKRMLAEQGKPTATP